MQTLLPAVLDFIPGRAVFCAIAEETNNKADMAKVDLSITKNKGQA